MAVHNVTGKLGENFAAALLEKKGYKLLCRNYRTYYGEIDIVASVGETIVFAEVRTRSSLAYSPLETVTKQKRKRIISAAYIYLEEYPTVLQPRFDVIAIAVKKGNTAVYDCQHFEGAFDGSEYDGGY